jgi:hypothetical protein
MSGARSHLYHDSKIASNGIITITNVNKTDKNLCSKANFIMYFVKILNKTLLIFRIDFDFKLSYVCKCVVSQEYLKATRPFLSSATRHLPLGSYSVQITSAVTDHSSLFFALTYRLPPTPPQAVRPATKSTGRHRTTSSASAYILHPDNNTVRLVSLLHIPGLPESTLL